MEVRIGSDLKGQYEEYPKKEMEFDVNSLDKFVLENQKADPQKFILKVFRDQLQDNIEVMNYPNMFYSVSLEVDAKEELGKSLNDGIQKIINSSYAFSVLEPIVEIECLAGKFSYKWGWKESDNWDAYHSVIVEAGLDPIIGIKLGIKCSLIQVALMFASIPPPISKLLADGIFDLWLAGYIFANAKTYLSHEKRTLVYHKERYILDFKFSVTGGIGIEVGAKLGPENIVSVKATGQINSSITGTGYGRYEKPDLSLFYNVKNDAVKFELEVTFSIGKKSILGSLLSTSFDKEWTIKEESYIIKDSKIPKKGGGNSA